MLRVGVQRRRQWLIAQLQLQREDVRDLVAEGIGVLRVEQNAALARSLCSRGYLMSGGQVLLSGTTEEMAHSDAVAHLYFGAV